MDPFKTNPIEHVDSEDQLGMEFLVEEKPESVEELNSTVGDEPDLFMRNEEVFDDQEHHKSFEDIQQEKSHYLTQLNRLIKRGHVSIRRFSMEHTLEEIRGEVYRIKKESDMDNGIDYCRQGLMFCVSTIEMMNGKYKVGGNLKGWSQTVMGNIESYDEVFEELYDTYYSKIKMAPEIKLITMVAGSAFMFHLNKSLFSNDSVAPSQREMEGPSFDTDELLQKLNDEVDIDDISNISSDSSTQSLRMVEETKIIPIKKRGRPKKQK
jgi:hypothetical protein